MIPAINQIKKNLLKKSKLYLRRNCHVPYGTDLLVDINRIYCGENIHTILDVGANVGQSKEWFRDISPDAAIYCFEPIVKTYHLLKKRFMADRHVYPFQVAMGDEAGIQEIHLQKNDQWNSLSPRINISQPAVSRMEKVPVTTLDRFCFEQNINHIDLLKIDTEGFELNVLQGAHENLEAGRISFILAEAGLQPDNNRHTAFFELYDFLYKYDLSLLTIYDQCIHKKEKRLLYVNALFRHISLM